MQALRQRLAQAELLDRELAQLRWRVSSLEASNADLVAQNCFLRAAIASPQPPTAPAPPSFSAAPLASSSSLSSSSSSLSSSSLSQWVQPPEGPVLRPSLQRGGQGQPTPPPPQPQQSRGGDSLGALLSMDDLAAPQTRSASRRPGRLGPRPGPPPDYGPSLDATHSTSTTNSGGYSNSNSSSSSSGGVRSLGSLLPGSGERLGVGGPRSLTEELVAARGAATGPFATERSAREMTSAFEGLDRQLTSCMAEKTSLQEENQRFVSRMDS